MQEHDLKNSNDTIPHSSSLYLPVNGIDKFILHEDFFRFLDLAFTVKALKHNLSSSNPLTFSEEDIKKIVKKIHSHFLPSKKHLTLLKGECLDTDEVMKNIMDSLCQDMKRQLSLNKMSLYEGKGMNPTLNQKCIHKGEHNRDAFGIKYSKRQTDILLNWMIQNKV
jgi:hypothetical protein